MIRYMASLLTCYVFGGIVIRHLPLWVVKMCEERGNSMSYPITRDQLKVRQRAAVQNASEQFELCVPAYPILLAAVWLVAGMAYAKKQVCKAIGYTPQCNSEFFDGIGPKCREVRKGAKRWPALHELYGYARDSVYEASPIGRMVDRLWLLGMKNPRGVRNRLRIVVSALSEELRAVLRREETVTILSLACGSAEAVFQAIATLGNDKHRVRLILLDQDQTAVAYAVNEAAKEGIEVQAIKASVARLKGVVKTKVDIVEMVGLLDYLSDGTAQGLFERIYEVLVPNGLFVTANILPNLEEPFLRHCADWEMVYRTPDKLRDLCGFVFNSGVEVTSEPLNIHAIAFCRKNH